MLFLFSPVNWSVLKLLRNFDFVNSHKFCDKSLIFVPLCFKQMWLYTTEQKQNATKPSDNPVLLVKDITYRNGKLDRELMYLLNKAKYYVPKTKPSGKSFSCSYWRLIIESGLARKRSCLGSFLGRPFQKLQFRIKQNVLHFTTVKFGKYVNDHIGCGTSCHMISKLF